MYEIPWYLFKLISENEKSRKKSDDSGSALKIVAREFPWVGNCVCLIEWECRSDALITRLLSCKKKRVWLSNRTDQNDQTDSRSTRRKIVLLMHNSKEIKKINSCIWVWELYLNLDRCSYIFLLQRSSLLSILAINSIFEYGMS